MYNYITSIRLTLQNLLYMKVEETNDNNSTTVTIIIITAVVVTKQNKQQERFGDAFDIIDLPDFVTLVSLLMYSGM